MNQSVTSLSSLPSPRYSSSRSRGPLLAGHQQLDALWHHRVSAGGHQERDDASEQQETAAAPRGLQILIGYRI